MSIRMLILKRRILRVRQFIRLLASLSLALFSISNALAQQHHQEKSVVRVQQLQPGIHMIEGRGGNIGLIEGSDSLFMIDAQFEELSEEIKGAMSAISKKPLRYLLNTHFHADHTSGNSAFAPGATLLAHDNVRRVLQSGGSQNPLGNAQAPAKASALPHLTYSVALKVFMGTETIDVRHYPNAHTGGDSVVFLRNSNVIHTGDIYFHGSFPFIDTGNGGSLDGYLSAMEEIKSEMNESTKLIPGHGAVATPADFERDLEMLRTVAHRVEEAVHAGKSLEETIASDPAKEFKEEYGKGFLKTEQFVHILYTHLQSNS